MKVWSVVKHYKYDEEGFDPIGVYTSEKLAQEAVKRFGDGEYGSITEHELDVLPEHGRKIEWYRCHDTKTGWVIEKLGGRPGYVYMPYTTIEKNTYPMVFVQAGNYVEAVEMAEYEKKYWTEKGIYGCSREHWETIKDKLRVK